MPPIINLEGAGASNGHQNMMNITTSRNLKDIYHLYELNNMPLALKNNHGPTLTSP
jgi:hypothetical protein